MNPPEIRAVAFDMDGLMFNTEDLYDQVGETLLSRRGHAFTLQLKLKMMGLPGPKAFEVLRSELGLNDPVETLQAESDEIFKVILPAQIATMKGLNGLLDLLESRKIPKAVATSSHRKFATAALGCFDLQRRFEFVLTAEDVTHGKPDPEIYLTTAKRLQVEPHQMLVLEDSLTGSRAAAAAGAFTIAVPTAHTRGLDFGHVDHVAESLEDSLILELFAPREESSRT